MPGRKRQKTRDLKRDAESCNKITGLFKKKTRKEVQESQENSSNIVHEKPLENENIESSAPPNIVSISGPEDLPTTSDQSVVSYNVNVETNNNDDKYALSEMSKELHTITIYRIWTRFCSRRRRILTQSAERFFIPKEKVWQR